MKGQHVGRVGHQWQRTNGATHQLCVRCLGVWPVAGVPTRCDGERLYLQTTGIAQEYKRLYGSFEFRVNPLNWQYAQPLGRTSW